MSASDATSDKASGRNTTDKVHLSLEFKLRKEKPISLIHLHVSIVIVNTIRDSNLTPQVKRVLVILEFSDINKRTSV